MSVHSVAAQGFGSGTNELYDRARPTYQPFALEHIRKTINVSSPVNVVEIGSGTGIFTRALLADPNWATSVRQLKAIEPSEGMREVFSKTVKDDRVSVSEGTFDSTRVEAGWADLVVIAQAYHWCPDYDKASAEFARILKPTGIVVFIWNLEDRKRAKWVAKLRDAYEAYEGGTPQFRLGLWRQTFDTPSYQKYFQPPEEQQWDYVIPTTVSKVQDRVGSKSYIALLPEKEKAEVLEAVKAIAESGGRVWIDEKEGVFEYPYETWAVIAHRK